MSLQKEVNMEIYCSDNLIGYFYFLNFVKNSNDDSDEEDRDLTYEELQDIEEMMFPDGVDEDNYPDLSGSD